MARLCHIVIQPIIKQLTLEGTRSIVSSYLVFTSMNIRNLGFAVALLTSAMQADTIQVPQDHSTIQAAINSANAGDTVLIDQGIYFEKLVINKPLHLEGVGTGGSRPVISWAGKNERPFAQFPPAGPDQSHATCRGWPLPRPDRLSAHTWPGWE